MRLLQLIDLYFRVCQVYDDQLIAHCFRHTKNGRQPTFTDSEVLTCYLFATGWQKCNGPKACYDYMSTHYRDCFPDLPSYQAFNHRLNRLAEVLPLFTQACFTAWRAQDGTQHSSTLVTDSFPVITASGHRYPSRCTVISNKGQCATKAMWYYGVKVHLMAIEQAGTLPLPEYLIISPASVHDKKAQEDELRNLKGVRVVADRAYVDAKLEKDMLDNGSELIVPARFNKGHKKQDKHRFKAAYALEQNVIARIRQPIETMFAWLVRNADIERACNVRSYRGLLIHIYGKIAAVICHRKLTVTVSP